MRKPLRALGFRVEVTDQGLPRRPSRKATEEIKHLRAVEAHMARESIRMDRLQRDLVGAHPGNLVILVGLPPGSWAPLPVGWQTMQQLSLTPRWPPVPLGIKGAIAVAADLAETIVTRARGE